MRVLYVDLKSLLEINYIVVKDDAFKAKYLINGYWGRNNTGFTVSSVFGDDLAQIIQTKAGLIPHFELKENSQLVCQFVRPLGNNHEFFYLPKIHWLVHGNLNKMQYSVATVKQKIMQTKITKDIPNKLQIKVNQAEDEPLCLCLIAILNFWSQQHKKTSNLNHYQSLCYSETT